MVEHCRLLRLRLLLLFLVFPQLFLELVLVVILEREVRIELTYSGKSHGVGVIKIITR